VEEPKNPDESYVYSLHQLFLNEKEKEQLHSQYRAGGMGWGKAKSLFFDTLNGLLLKPREEYNRLMDDTGYLDQVLAEGAQKARAISEPFMEEVRRVTGISSSIS
jgi:tryptophanyl-tRNA synthetase